MKASDKSIKVSVIIPVYNVAEYLPRCIDSLLNQTLKEIEIICVNDSSPDNSGAIIDSYALHDPRVKVIHKKTNEGPMVARKDGYKMAHGKYYFFCDGDDFLPDTGLADLYKIAQDTKADITVGKAMMKGIRGDGPIRRNFSGLDSSWQSYLRYLLNWGTPALWGILFKHNLFEETEYTAIKGMKISEDRRLITEILILRHPAIAYLDKVVYYYWNNPRSTSRTKPSESAIRSQFDSLFGTYDFIESHSREFTSLNKGQMIKFLSVYIENGVSDKLLRTLNSQIPNLLLFSSMRRYNGTSAAIHTSLCIHLPGYSKIMKSLRYFIRFLRKKV